MNTEPAVDINANINSMNEQQLKDLRRFLFEERVSVINERNAQKELYEKFMAERLSFREEMRLLNSKVLSERKRLKDEQLFFDKKLNILQSGFANLEMDRKKFEKEKRQFEESKRINKVCGVPIQDVSFLFNGVTSYLGLRKRYRDLIKIYHPDNMDGDGRMAVAIKETFEKLKEKY